MPHSHSTGVKRYKRGHKRTRSARSSLDEKAEGRESRKARRPTRAQYNPGRSQPQEDPADSDDDNEDFVDAGAVVDKNDPDYLYESEYDDDQLEAATRGHITVDVEVDKQLEAKCRVAHQENGLYSRGHSDRVQCTSNDEDEGTVWLRYDHMGLYDNNLDEIPLAETNPGDGEQATDSPPLSPLTAISASDSELSNDPDPDPDTEPFVRGADGNYKSIYHVGAVERDRPQFPGPKRTNWRRPPRPVNGKLLSGKEKFVRARVVKAIFERWPNSEINEAEAQKLEFALADSAAFWHTTLRVTYESLLSEWAKTATGRKGKENYSIAYKLFKRIKDEVDEYTPLQSPLIKAFLCAFVTCVKQCTTGTSTNTAALPVDLKLVMDRSEALAKAMADARRAGEICLQQAEWLGLERSNEGNFKAQKKKVMVESDKLRKTGISSGAVKADGSDVLMIDGSWNRICAPKKSQGSTQKMQAIMLWDRKGPNDKPSWDNQFGAIIYNPNHIVRAFTSSRESGFLKKECEGIYHNVRTKTTVQRGEGVADRGKIIKLGGPHSTRGALTQPLSYVKKSTAKNPTKKSQHSMIEQKQLRIDILRETSAMQACAFAFMLGFLPFAAYEQYIQAKGHKLLNNLGRPNISSFAAFAYSAGLHTDNDVCISHGWVFQRSNKIKRDESNFVWGDYRLVVELEEEAHWFWRAKKDAHGTTTNNLAMTQPIDWKDYVVHKPNDAQWTYAQTIPKAVANAALNHTL